MGTWWNTPRAYTYNGHIYTGGVQEDGTIAIAAIDPADEAAASWYSVGTFEDDDHNAPALLIASDRPPLVGYVRHGVDNAVRVRKGSTIGDISTLGIEKQLATSAAATYANLWRRPGTDEVWFVARTGQFNTADPWVFFKSNDYGDTWGAGTPLFDRTNFTGGYLGMTQVGSTVRVALAKHPSMADNRVWYLEIDLDTGTITRPSDGATLGNLDGTNLPIDPNADADLIHTSADTGLRLLAVSSRSTANGGPSIGVVTWNDDTAADNIYRHIDYDGGAWTTTEVCEAGQVIGFTASVHYHAGIEFPWDTVGNELLVARHDGTTWRIERWTLSGTTWSLDTEYASATTRVLARPAPSVGGGFMWYDAATYPDFNTYTDPQIRVRATT